MIPLIAISHALTPSGVVAWLDLTPSLRGDASYLRGNLRKNSKKCYGNYYFLDCRTPSGRDVVAPTLLHGWLKSLKTCHTVA
ncbi:MULTISPECIES: hypothetical protein [unclassified Rickettsia]|uniref:hypothetical protein n=1 Tax=unclassified Rickettsia TaxID=114295 RepID=UPI003132E5D6